MPRGGQRQRRPSMQRCSSCWAGPAEARVHPVCDTTWLAGAGRRGLPCQRPAGMAPLLVQRGGTAACRPWVGGQHLCRTIHQSNAMQPGGTQGSVLPTTGTWPAPAHPRIARQHAPSSGPAACPAAAGACGQWESGEGREGNPAQQQYVQCKCWGGTSARRLRLGAQNKTHCPPGRALALMERVQRIQSTHAPPSMQLSFSLSETKQVAHLYESLCSR